MSRERGSKAWLWVLASIVALAIAAFAFLFRVPEGRPPVSDVQSSVSEVSAQPSAPSTPSSKSVTQDPPPLAPSAAASPTPTPTPLSARPPQTVALPEIGPDSPLPFIAPGTAAGQSLALLRPYAEKGHQKAACLIAAALTPCRISYDYAIGDSASLCGGVTRNDAADATKYLWQTAQNGNVDARNFFALYPPVANAQLASSDEYQQIYRDRAPQLVHAGVQGGSTTALWIAFAQSAGMTPNAAPGALPRSDYYAIVYGTVLRQITVGPQVAQIDERLAQLRTNAPNSGVDLARALKEADKLREQRFTGKNEIPFESLNPAKIECN